MKKTSQALIVAALAPTLWAAPITKTTTQTAAFEISLEESVVSDSIGNGEVLLLEAEETKTFSFSPFDPSMGTLLGVSFSATGTVEATLSALGSSSQDEFEMLLDPLIAIKVTDPGGTFVFNDSLFPVLRTCSSEDAAGLGQVCEIGPSTITDPALSTLSLGNPPDPALYTGSAIDLDLSVKAIHKLLVDAADGSFSGTVGIGQSLLFSGMLTVEYLWEEDTQAGPGTPPPPLPVPEPGTLVLLISGLLPLRWLAYKRSGTGYL